MVITFRQSIATERGGFVAGQVLCVPSLPKGWDAWARAGVIGIERSPSDREAAEYSPAREVSVTMTGRGRGRGGARTKTVA